MKASLKGLKGFWRKEGGCKNRCVLFKKGSVFRLAGFLSCFTTYTNENSIERNPRFTVC